MCFFQKLTRNSRVFLLCCIAVSLVSCAKKSKDTVAGIPYYFYAIHNEPWNLDSNREKLDSHYPTLRQMVAKADEYNIKLTLMFAAPWVDYFRESPERMAEFEAWKKAGHEIAIHRHSIYHGNRWPGRFVGDWDGYSELPQAEAIAHRGRLLVKVGRQPEPYHGTLSDFIDRIKVINPDIKSGCANDEGNRNALPDEIIYDTCSGFANFGEVGRRSLDEPSQMGMNEYITVGNYNGIERKWLAHYFMSPSPSVQAVKSARETFASMSSGVYGTVNHGEAAELEVFSAYLDFLHRVDPEGKMSKTLTEIIEEELIPEKRISDALVSTVTEWSGYPVGKEVKE